MGPRSFFRRRAGPKRKDLIDDSRGTRQCRLFLATDAGGVGLNLQNASVVVNLDQPWNPAVLEQRIGRVHRLGQHRPVRVVAFHRPGDDRGRDARPAGIQEIALQPASWTAGQDEVFMGGTRLKQFMESVEKATTAISKPMPVEPPR